MARRPPGGTRAQRAGVEAKRRAGFTVGLDIGGTKLVQKRLKRLKLHVARRVVNRANEQAAERILKPAINANLADVSPGRHRTRPKSRGQASPGRLKTLGAETEKVKPKKATSMYWQVRTPSRAALKLQSKDAYYPHLLEVGSKTSGFRRPVYIEGKHMLKRARDQKSARIRVFLRRTINKFMEDEIKKMGKRNINRAAKGKKPLSAFRPFRQRASFKKRGIL